MNNFDRACHIHNPQESRIIMRNVDKAVELIDSYFEAHIPHNEANFGAGEELAEALKDTGLLAPDLPEPDAVKLDGDTKYFAARGIQVRQNAESDHVQVYTKVNLTTTEARRLALALLAAANYAEKEQDND